MKFIIALILISVNLGFSETKMNGNVSFSQQYEKQIASNNNVENILKIYENHKIMISISNALSVDLDCFNHAIKEANVFTTLKIDF
jgi:hypothetical protein